MYTFNLVHFSSQKNVKSESTLSVIHTPPTLCLCTSPVSHCPHQNKQDHGPQPLANSISLSVPQNPEDCPICKLSLKEGARAVGDSANEEEDEEDAVKETGKEENHLEERGDEEQKKKKKRSCFGQCRDVWTDMRRKLWGIVESKYFSRGIMIAILINTISMGIEHHNQVNLQAVIQILFQVRSNQFIVAYHQHIQNNTSHLSALFK